MTRLRWLFKHSGAPASGTWCADAHEDPGEDPGVSLRAPAPTCAHLRAPAPCAPPAPAASLQQEDPLLPACAPSFEPGTSPS